MGSVFILVQAHGKLEAIIIIIRLETRDCMREYIYIILYFCLSLLSTARKLLELDASNLYVQL